VTKHYREKEIVRKISEIRVVSQWKLSGDREQVSKEIYLDLI